MGQLILQRLKLPCQVRFADEGENYTAKHLLMKKGNCYILINACTAISRPEHIILHEAAHHGQRRSRQSHGPSWAKKLLSLYQQAGIRLPRTTRFKAFARLIANRTSPATHN
jgi:hypothetical protein